MRDSSTHAQLMRTRPAPAGASPVPPAAWTPARILAAVGAAGPLVFLAVATLAGLLDPGYNTRTQTVSELAVGPHGWIQTVNFYIFGASIVAFALALFRGLRRRSYAGALLLIVVGACVFASGLYPTDLKGAPVTSAGTIHNQLFLLAFLALMISYVFHAVALRREGSWRGYALYTALTAPATFSLMFVFVGFGSDPGDPLYGGAGLIQRALIAVAFGWMTVIGRRLLARRAGEPGRAPVGAAR
jgi:hypothetical membrane protein